MGDIALNGRQYRYNYDDDGGPIRWAKLEAEYFNETLNDWRRVNNWNTRELIFIQLMDNFAIAEHSQEV